MIDEAGIETTPKIDLAQFYMGIHRKQVLACAYVKNIFNCSQKITPNSTMIPGFLRFHASAVPLYKH